MSSIDALILRIPVQSPTLIGLDLPPIALIGIAEKRKQILTCTQEIARAMLERLRSATRLIHGDQMITTTCKGFNKTEEPISLLAFRLRTIKHVN
jgi:hypothetical protein